MNENLKKLFDTIKEDENLVEKFKACKSAEEAYEVATAVVDGYSIEEFKDIMLKIDKAAKQSGDMELADDDLNQVAGGLSTGDWLLIGGSAAAGVATITGGIVSSAAGGV